MHNFIVEVNGRNVEVTKADTDALDLIPLSSNSYAVLKDNKNIHIEVIADDPLTILVNGKEYTMTVKDEIDQLVDELGFQSTDAALLSQIMAPMPGLVFSVHVKNGQEVKEGDSLLILEAMKMENVISSPIDGVIKAVHVYEKSAIEKGALLIEFE